MIKRFIPKIKVKNGNILNKCVLSLCIISIFITSSTMGIKADEVEEDLLPYGCYYLKTSDNVTMGDIYCNYNEGKNIKPDEANIIRYGSARWYMMMFNFLGMPNSYKVVYYGLAEDTVTSDEEVAWNQAIINVLGNYGLNSVATGTLYAFDKASCYLVKLIQHPSYYIVALAQELLQIFNLSLPTFFTDKTSGFFNSCGYKSKSWVNKAEILAKRILNIGSNQNYNNDNGDNYDGHNKNTNT